MPRRPLTPPPPPSPQKNPPTPGGPVGLPAHLQRPQQIKWENFPQHRAFLGGLPMEHPAHVQVQSLLNQAQTDPVAAQTLQDREAQGNFSPYTGFTPQAPGDPVAPSMGAGDITRDVVDAVNSGIGAGVHNIAKAGVHGLGFLARQGEGLTNAVFGTESGIAGELTGAFDQWDADSRTADGSIYAPKTVPGMVAQPLAQAVPGFMAGGPLLQGTQVATAPWLAQGLARGGIADALAFDPMAPRGSDVYNDFVTANGGSPTLVTEALAQQPDDSELVGRLKNLAEGGILGTALEAGLRGAGRGLSALRPGAPVPEVPLPPEALARGEFTPVEGGPALPPPQRGPVAPEPVSPFETSGGFGQFGDGAGQSPFGGQFSPEPPRPVGEFPEPVDAAPLPAAAGRPGEPPLPDIVRGDFVPTATRRVTDEAGLPAGRPGRFVETGDAPAMQPDGLPAIQRGEFVDAPDARTAIDGRPAELPDEGRGTGFFEPDADPRVPQGYRQFNADTAEYEGYYKPQPRRPNIRPQPRDPTSMGEDPVVTGPHPGTGGIDPNAETWIGETYLDPVDVDTPRPMRPIEPPGSRMQRARSNTTPGDPYADTFRKASEERAALRGRGEDPEAVEPLDAFTPAQVGALGRTSGTTTEVQIDPVQARSEQATEPVGAPVREDIRPVASEPTTQIQAPISTPKPGLKHLSPAAQEFVSGLKPGEREAVASTIAHLRRNPDPEGDLGNLQQVLAFKKPGRASQAPKVQPLADGEGKAPTRSEANLIEGGSTPRADVSPQPPKAKAVDGKAPTPVTGTPAPTPEDVPNRGAGGDVPRDAGQPRPKDVGPGSPGSPDSGQRELYSGGPREVFDYPLAAAKVGLQYAGKALDTWATPLVKVVERFDGGRELATKARAVLDTSRRLMGRLDAARARALKSVTGVGPKARAAQAKFQEVDWEGDLGFSYIHDVLDGNAQVVPLVKEYVAGYRDAFYQGGKMAEDAGYKIRVGKNREVAFTADKTRTRAARVFTRDMRWYANRPEHPATQKLMKLIAERNKMNVSDVQEEFRLLADRGVTKRNMAEDARSIEIFPSHFRDHKGRLVQLLETDPQKVIDAAARRFPARVAYVTHMGQQGVPPEFTKVGASGGQGAAEDLLRALNGMPVDDVGGRWDLPEPGSHEAQAARAAEVPWTAWKGLKLSQAPLANIPETVGKGRAITGGGITNFIKAGFTMSFLNRNADALVDDLAKRGALSRDFVDWAYNPANRTETLNRYALNITGAINNAVNEYNEKVVAYMAKQWSSALKSGKGGRIDKFRLEVLEFTPEQIHQIMSGKASPEMYDDVMGRAVEWAQGSTSQSAERSYAGNNRAWNLATVADRFAQMNVNRNFGVWAKVAKKVFSEEVSWKDKVAAVTFATGLQVGQTAAAAMTLALRKWVVGGTVAASGAAFYDYMVDATMYSILGGPVQATYNAATDESRSIADHFGGTLLPISTLQELSDMFRGNGTYEGMGAIEGAAEFLRRGTPAAGAMANVIATAGFREDDKELDASIAAFRKWEKDYHPGPKVTGGDEDGATFRRAMRLAADAMQNGTDPSEAIYKALGEKDAAAVAKSLRAKRILNGYRPKGSDAEDLKKAAKYNEAYAYLGARTMAKIEQYDALLDAWASAISPPRRY